jgi:hypothetical protein
MGEDERQSTGDRQSGARVSARRGLACTALACFFAATLIGCGGNSGSAKSAKGTDSGEGPSASGKKSSSGGSKKPALPAPVKLPRPEFETVRVAVFTEAPGFAVLVDQEPARAEDGGILLTPCEIDMLPGEHVITVAKQGYREQSQEVTASEGRELEFRVAYEPFAEPTGFAASRFATATVGEELPLSALNTGGPLADPFVSGDGLALWTAGERDGQNGVYVSRRRSVWDEFPPPDLIVESRITSDASSPSVSADGTRLAYLVAGKARIWGVFLGDDRQPRKPLKFSTAEDEVWDSATISGSGLSLYSIQRHGSERRELVTHRAAPEDDFEDDWDHFPMHGGQPVLSTDGRRLYLFDGKTLRRAARLGPLATFGAPEELLTLDLKKYVPRERRRQYWVTDDEQWLYFSDDPEKSGNLYVVRIADIPAWRFVPRGRSIRQREMAAAPTESPSETPSDEPGKPVAEPPKVDPRSLPLPYQAFRDSFGAALAERDFAAADELLDRAKQDEALRPDADLLEWDAEFLATAKEFEERLVKLLSGLAKGETVRIGGAGVTFEAFSDGEVLYSSRGKGLSKKLADISPTELAAIVEARSDKTDPVLPWQSAAWLLCMPERVPPSSIQPRLAKAGIAGREYLDRERQRELRLIEGDVARNNLGPALRRIDALVAKAPQSESATRALALREELPVRQNWRPVGGQSWKLEAPGTYATGDAKAAESFLLCEDEFGDFQLTLEWKSVGPAAQGGVYFRYGGVGPLRDNAYKVHLANDASLRANPDKYATGALLGSVAPLVNAVKAEGEWNTLEVRVVDSKLSVKINGTVAQKDTPLEKVKLPVRGKVLVDGEFPGMTYRKVLCFELPKGK